MRLAEILANAGINAKTVTAGEYTARFPCDDGNLRGKLAGFWLGQPRQAKAIAFAEQGEVTLQGTDENGKGKLTTQGWRAAVALNLATEDEMAEFHEQRKQRKQKRNAEYAAEKRMKEANELPIGSTNGATV